MVAGYAVGGGQVLHLVCDLTIAADNARFGQTGPRVGSLDGGYGAGLLRDQVGPKKAQEIWFLCRQYDAQQALDMGLVNTVVPLDRLEDETVAWCREMLALSPFALRLPRRASTRTRTAWPASSSSRTTPTSSSTPATRRRRAARPTRRSARPTSPGSPGARERGRALRGPHLADGGAAADAAGGRRAVLVGTALAGTGGTFKVLAFLAALIGALFIQVGTNLSNDYSDARRGADTEDRLGPCA